MMPRVGAAAILLFLAACARGQDAASYVSAILAGVGPPQGVESYVLAAEDRLTVKVLDLPDIDDKTVYAIDQRGNLNLPVTGRVPAAGLTLEQLEEAIAKKLTNMREPQVSVSISEFRSHPVSVLGSVNQPGVMQVQGNKTLFEVISKAGGLRPDAGNAIYITRAKQDGPLGLPDSGLDASGYFYTGKVAVRSVLEGKDPQSNILVLSDDVVTVPKADLIYVVGSVKRSGGFVLSERSSLSVLEALAMAEGMDKVAAASKARILRSVPGQTERMEFPIDLKQVLEGKVQDARLQANDILFVPSSKMKAISYKAAEAAIQIGTGVAIYGRY